MRVYFYNPNNDSGQDWGAGVTVSTAGNGERHGEASLPFDQFASRLYLFHDTLGDAAAMLGEMDTALIAEIRALAEASWARTRLPDTERLVGLDNPTS